MDMVRIERDGAPPIELPARLMLETDRHTERMQDGERGFQLFLYETGDGYIPGIRVLTTFHNEKSRQLVEIVESTKDVENFFFVYEPAEYLPASMMASMFPMERDQLVSRLLEMYDRQVAQILDVLADPLTVTEAAGSRPT